MANRQELSRLGALRSEFAFVLRELGGVNAEAWMENRGMGFIAPSDGSADLFVHRSSLQDGGPTPPDPVVHVSLSI